MGELASRRLQTEARIRELLKSLQDAERLARNKACAYATGSFGRGESSRHSDLDLFILGKPDRKRRSRLSSLDEICLKSVLIQVTRQLHIPEFSGDGQYLQHFSLHDLTRTLGTPEDDSRNTFTARLLLLLESRPLLGAPVYQESIEAVIAGYWRDFEDHRNSFMPAFLANDILRLWRTFCVNYEARSARVPEEKKAKGKLKNYKLKHSRLLTCYSALIYLLAVFESNKTVTPKDAMAMVARTPTQRLEWILTFPALAESHETVRQLIGQYELFLKNTNTEEANLVSLFLDKDKSKAAMDEAYTFGDLVYTLLSSIGKGNRFHRLLVV